MSVGELGRLTDAEYAEFIADEFNLPRSLLRAKQAAIFAEYGDAYIYGRDLEAGRSCLLNSLRRRPSARIAVRLLGTFAPVGLLDQISNVRRRFLNRSGFKTSGSTSWEGDAPAEPHEKQDFPLVAARREPRPPGCETTTRQSAMT